MVSPIFSSKTDDLFSHRPARKWLPFLAVVSSPLSSSHVVYPVFLLNSARNKNNFIGVSPSWWCLRGGSLPSRPLVSAIARRDQGLSWHTKLLSLSDREPAGRSVAAVSLRKKVRRHAVVKVENRRLANCRRSALCRLHSNSPPPPRQSLSPCTAKLIPLILLPCVFRKF